MRRLLMLLTLVAGCASSEARLAFVSSYPTQASWSLVVDDRARGAEIWIDGRPRTDNCDRVRTQIRCELRGLFPGGHTVELRTAGAVLRRSVLVGAPWRDKLALVRVKNEDEAEAAAKAGADGVIIVGGDWKPIVDTAHKAGIRALVVGDPGAIEWAGADGVVGGSIPAALHARFPEARALDWPPEAKSTDDARALLDRGNVIVTADAFDALRDRKKKRVFY
ncbi:MAG TPA: hypothetical protein VF334_06845 [Polyangia bacterium]